MFTGIIEATAAVVERRGGRLRIERPPAFDDLRSGASMCVSGACLTIVELDAASISFDVIPETLQRTTLGSLQAGDRVNLERALPASGRFDGHIVQGHVEGVGVVALPARPGRSDGEEGLGDEQTLLHVALPVSLLPFVVSKGSIAVDGVSLTVASLEGDRLTVALIPETMKRTILGSLRSEDRVNIETDILARYVKSLKPNT